MDDAAARRLWTITMGNALYLRQLVDGELESGRLHEVAEVFDPLPNLRPTAHRPVSSTCWPASCTTGMIKTPPRS